MSADEQNRNTQIADWPSAQQLVLGEVDAIVSFWPEVREDDAIAPHESMNILAVWGHLRRFLPESLKSDVVGRLDDLVKSDIETLVGRFMQCIFPADWITMADAIDEAWDDAVSQEEADDLTRAIREHFEFLDRHQLALYAANHLVDATVAIPRFAELTETVSACHREAEQYLADHIDVFFPAASYAVALLGSYRQDLDSYDTSLFETTLKHRRLEELLEERDWAIPAPFTEGQKREMLIALRKTPSPLQPANRNKPGLITLLIDRNQEITSHATQPALAASVREQSGPAGDALRQATWRVVEEPAIQVRIGLSQSENDQRKMVVTLVGPISDTDKYVSLEFVFSNGDSKQIKFQLGCAVTLLREGEVTDILSLALLDQSGVRRSVELEEASDGK